MEIYHDIDSLEDFPSGAKHPSSFLASSDRVAEHKCTTAKTELKILKFSLCQVSTNSSIWKKIQSLLKS